MYYCKGDVVYVKGEKNYFFVVRRINDLEYLVANCYKCCIDPLTSFRIDVVNCNGSANNRILLHLDYSRLYVVSLQMAAKCYCDSNYYQDINLMYQKFNERKQLFLQRRRLIKKVQRSELAAVNNKKVDVSLIENRIDVLNKKLGITSKRNLSYVYSGKGTKQESFYNRFREVPSVRSIFVRNSYWDD